MAITIADIRFEYHDYDERGDTLFLERDGELPITLRERPTVTCSRELAKALA